MKTQPSRYVGLAALTYGLVLLSCSVVAEGSSSEASCYPNLIGDGYCNPSQNTQECGYDGGDCCECTCTSGVKYACGSSDFTCVDPDAACIEDVAVTAGQESEFYMSSASSETNNTALPCASEYFADGDCDFVNNNEECGYDDGDCCECTCVSTDAFTCGDESHGGFDCVDPSAPCIDADDDDSTTETPGSLCVAPFFADGDCDLFNNSEECGYDSGDCCKCTCESTSQFTCGDSSHGGFACIDPSAPCVDDDDVTINPSTEDTTYYGSTTTEFNCIPDYLGDGLCDLINNDEACGYDGGDCCQCTCVSTPEFTCGDPEYGGYFCLDPSAPCVDDDDVTVFPDDTTTLAEYTETMGCNTGWISDGDCDPSNNQKDCDWDGGDCCSCTCNDTMSFTCGESSHGGFDCIDPDAPCVDDIDDDITLIPGSDDEPTYTEETTTSLSCVPGFFSDGVCDLINNNEVCGYDGGDCCECTCVSTEDYSCGDDSAGSGFECIDPDAPCVDCLPGDFSDGLCDLVNNIEACGYDGGDCCECTCESTPEHTCGDPSLGRFYCLDPSAPCVENDDVTVFPEETSTEGYTETFGCNVLWISDGDCDGVNNNDDCGYDGGDCCECTCESTESFACGDEDHGGYDCINPDALCVNDDDDDSTPFPEDDDHDDSTGTTTSSSCIPGLFANGICNFVNNAEVCGFDGGDCCECTCVSTEENACGDEPFDCLDPDASCFEEEDDDGPCVPEYVSDGECDSINNNEICGFDGGDCCECTCVSTEEHLCGDEPFECLDPSASCFEEEDDDGPCVPGYVSDGICDFINNDEICGYDGGDCCECTCVSTEEHTCGDEPFECVDPTAPCFEEDDDSPCLPDNFSNGICDDINNDELCGYDGGDCCECTCVSTEEFTCGDEPFDCIDPSASCVDDDDDIISLESDTDSPTISCQDDDVGNGLCDSGNNNEECGYDGGDCCECTCISNSDFTCGENAGFDCIDPEPSCEEGLVEAGTKTTIGVSTNTYDTRAGAAFGDVGCGGDGCGPELTRDGSVVLESRWACAQKLNPEGGLCEIEFVFGDPQDLKEVQVAFFKGDVRTRTLQATVNGEVIGQFNSNPATPFTTYRFRGVGVQTMAFTTVGLTENDWISFLEVHFMVQP